MVAALQSVYADQSDQIEAQTDQIQQLVDEVTEQGDPDEGLLETIFELEELCARHELTIASLNHSVAGTPERSPKISSRSQSVAATPERSPRVVCSPEQSQDTYDWAVSMFKRYAKAGEFTMSACVRVSSPCSLWCAQEVRSKARWGRILIFALRRLSDSCSLLRVGVDIGCVIRCREMDLSELSRFARDIGLLPNFIKVMLQLDFLCCRYY